MPIQVIISDADTVGFNAQARTKLRETTELFVANVIDEANRIEAGHNIAHGSPEVTSSMVSDAASWVQRGLSRPKKKIGWLFLRVLGTVLALFVGILYDKTKQNPADIPVFLFITAAAILCLTISILKE